MKGGCLLFLAGAFACAPEPGLDAGLEKPVVDSGYEVLDGGLLRFFDLRPRSCAEACREIGLSCTFGYWNGHITSAVYDYGECQRTSGCSQNYFDFGLCYSDLPEFPVQWFACGCTPPRDAGP